MPIKDFSTDQNGGPTGGDDAATGSVQGFLAFMGGPPSGDAPQPPQDTGAPSILINYNERFADAEPTMFRDALIEQVLSVLIGKTKPNAVMNGPAGVGKTKIAEDIARRIAVGDSLIPDQLREHTIYELPISEIVSGSSMVGQIEAKLHAVINFARDPKNKAILFIDEIHLVVNERDASYSKLAEIFKPALARGDLRVLGATTTQEARDLDTNPAFNRRFTRVVVDELTRGQTFTVLESVRPGFVTHYRDAIRVDDNVLTSTVIIADEISRAGSHRPDNAITLLDRAMADRVLEQKRMITRAEQDGDIPLVQALKSVGQLTLTRARVEKVAKRMLTGQADAHDFGIEDLRSQLAERIKGQDEALNALTDRIERDQLGLFGRSTPLTWMLAGASGVGKTETVKIISRAVTDQEPIILNMTEYNSSAAVNRIIGSPDGYVGFDSNAELPFDALDANPHRVILLDEFEKCDPAVQRLFLSAFDEGYIRSSRGKIIDFSKAIVFATTNAAREQLEARSIGFGSTETQVSHQSLTKALAQHFDAELLGRFTLLVGFKPITETIFRQILASTYGRLREELAENRPHLAARLPGEIPAGEIDSMVRAVFVPTQGARPAGKVVQTWVEDQVHATQATTALLDDSDEEEVSA